MSLVTFEEQKFIEDFFSDSFVRFGVTHVESVL